MGIKRLRNLEGYTVTDFNQYQVLRESLNKQLLTVEDRLKVLLKNLTDFEYVLELYYDTP